MHVSMRPSWSALLDGGIALREIRGQLAQAPGGIPVAFGRGSGGTLEGAMSLLARCRFSGEMSLEFRMGDDAAVIVG